MNYINQLKELLTTDVLVEVNENLKELEEELAKTKKKKPIQEEIKYMKDVKQYFNEVLNDIEKETLTQEQALDILEGLEDMKAENQEV